MQVLYTRQPHYHASLILPRTSTPGTPAIHVTITRSLCDDTLHTLALLRKIVIVEARTLASFQQPHLRGVWHQRRKIAVPGTRYLVPGAYYGCGFAAAAGVYSSRTPQLLHHIITDVPVESITHAADLADTWYIIRAETRSVSQYNTCNDSRSRAFSYRPQLPVPRSSQARPTPLPSHLVVR